MKIAFLGDICLTGKFDLEINPQAYSQFDQIKSILEDYDLVIANLESPFTDQKSSRICKAIHIKASPASVKLLEYLGVSAVSLANNHFFDYGQEGYESTLMTLADSGIDYFGTNNRSIIIEKNNERIILGGFCCLSTHPSNIGRGGGNVLNYSNIKHFLEKAKTQKAFPVASVHWGDENIHYPRLDHVGFARMMATEYDFLLHGHHPHVVQGLEMYKSSLIAYSLGNFCTDDHISWSVKNMKVTQSSENKKSYILGVTLKKGEISSHEVIHFMDDNKKLIIQNNHKLKKSENDGYQTKESLLPLLNGDRYNLPNEDVPQVIHSRYSIPWFVNRLNYYFIGAFLKGIVNRMRYYIYFREIRRMSNNLDL